jgi:hypothetical protein
LRVFVDSSSLVIVLFLVHCYKSAFDVSVDLIIFSAVF